MLNFEKKMGLKNNLPDQNISKIIAKIYSLIALAINQFLGIDVDVNSISRLLDHANSMCQVSTSRAPASCQKFPFDFAYSFSREIVKIWNRNRLYRLM